MRLKAGDMFSFEGDAASWMLLVTAVNIAEKGDARIILFQTKPQGRMYGSEYLCDITLHSVLDAGWKHVG